MHLIEPLCSGVNGAANGTVDIYRRGTNTRATYYPSFEASTAVTPTAAIQLDAYGGVLVYVNELVNCIVKDASGNTVRTFVAGAQASACEVISDSFTGTDYVTGLVAVSKPTTAQAIFDKWNDSAGAADFNVLQNGVAVSIATALSRIGSFFYNVKSPAYGAAGDGVADDTTPILSALAACGAAGGGIVFFPPGTYRIAQSLTTPAGVSLLGCSGVTTIKMDHPTATGWVSFQGQATGSQQSIRGIRFDAVQANSGHVIQWNNVGGGFNARLLVEDCVIGNPTLMSGRLVYCSGSAGVRVRSCTIYMGTGNTAVHAPSASGSVLGNTFVWAAQAYTGTCLYLGGASTVVGNDFDVSLQTSGATTILDASNTPYAPVFVGNGVDQPNNQTVVAYVGYSSTMSTHLVDSGNAFGNGTSVTMTLPVPASAASTHSGPQLTTRIPSRFYLADNFTATLNADPVRYGYLEYERASTNAAQLNFGQPVAVGMPLILAWYNNQASGSGTITLDAFVKGLTSFTVNANSVSYYYFMSVERGSATRKWVLVGSLVNQTP